MAFCHSSVNSSVGLIVMTSLSEIFRLHYIWSLLISFHFSGFQSNRLQYHTSRSSDHLFLYKFPPPPTSLQKSAHSRTNVSLKSSFTAQPSLSRNSRYFFFFAITSLFFICAMLLSQGSDILCGLI